MESEPVILHHTGGGDYNFARTDGIENGGTHTQLTPNWGFTGAHFPRNGDWEYNVTNDRLYHLSGDQLVMWTHNDSAYPGGSFLTSTPNGESSLASQSTLIYSLKNDLGWTNSGTGTSLWGNSVTAVGNVLYLIRGESSSDNWPFNEGRGLINNADFARVVVNQNRDYSNYYYASERTNLPDLPFNVGKGGSAVYLNGYLYVTQGDTLTVADDAGNVEPLNQEGIRLPSITDEFEDNDTQATATDIRNQEGNYFTDLLLTDEDWYQIEATSGESWLRLNYEIGSSANPVTFNLYDEESNLITSSDSLQNSPYVQYLNVALPGEGNYYLQWVPSGDGNAYSFIWDTFGLPNLTVNDASVSSANPNPGETISVSWTVENTGEFDTWENWYDAVYLSDDTTFDYGNDIYLTAAYNNYYQGNPLSPGANYTKTLDVTIPEYVGIGNKYLLFVTDSFDNFSPYGSQPESDNSDNVYNIPIFINGDAPNLVITEATAPTSGSLNSYIDVSWTVQNQGTSPTTALAWYDSIYFSTDTTLDFEEDIYLSDSYVSEFSELFVPPLDPGETYAINASIYLYSNLGGSGYLLFTTDTYNDQTESNESDNTRYVSLEIASPNLVITNITAPTTATTSQSISLSWTVENDSSVTTGSSYWYDRVVFSKNQIFGDSDDIYLTEQYIYSANGLPLEANETYTASSTLTLPSQAAGSGYLLFKTDNYNYQQETNETDNVYVRAIDIAAPNLVVTSVTAPTTATASQSISLSWTVENDSSVTTGSSYWYDRVVFSKNQIFGDSDDIYLTEQYIYSANGLPLEANETYTASSTLTLTQSSGRKRLSPI